MKAGYSDVVHSPSPSAILPRLLHIPRAEDIQGPGAGNWEMLVPSPKVGGKPQFDEMIFLDPNFDPRVYTISTPIPQYDPLDPSKPYKGNSAHRVNSSNAGSGAPPVQKSRYVIP